MAITEHLPRSPLLHPETQDRPRRKATPRTRGWSSLMMSADRPHWLGPHSWLTFHSQKAQRSSLYCNLQMVCKILFQKWYVAFWGVYFPRGTRLPFHWLGCQPARHLDVRKTWASIDCPNHLSLRFGFYWLFWWLKKEEERIHHQLFLWKSLCPEGLLNPAGLLMEVSLELVYWSPTGC